MKGTEYLRAIQANQDGGSQAELAPAVRFAVTAKRQPLELPMEWTHSKHHLPYEEIALRKDQADYEACFLHRSATCLMAVAMNDGIRAVVPDPKDGLGACVFSVVLVRAGRS